jgi:hypothetical protein
MDPARNFIVCFLYAAVNRNHGPLGFGDLEKSEQFIDRRSLRQLYLNPLGMPIARYPAA